MEKQPSKQGKVGSRKDGVTGVGQPERLQKAFGFRIGGLYMLSCSFDCGLWTAAKTRGCTVEVVSVRSGLTKARFVNGG